MDIPFLIALLGFFHLAATTCPQNCTFDEISPSIALTWFPCNDGFFCAKLDVPLDYQNPNLGRASVPLVRYLAQSNSSDGPYQGIILLNPGGPGASGVSEALNNGSNIQAVVGTNWDIVGFDPRGMWLSQPLANCSANITSDQTITSRSRMVPRVSDEFYNSFIESGKELGELCEETIGGDNNAGPHMSTAVTARDMLSIVNAYAETEDGQRASKPSNLLNYYGISYGTFLGQTFASMFPDSVGNVVLDGIVSPKGYLANFTSESVYHLDGIIASFFIYCHESGPLGCSYYTGSTPKDIYERFNRSFVQLDPRKAEAENWSNATDLEAALLGLKIALLATADAPFSYFASLPNVLVDLESAISAQNTTAWTAQLTTIFGDPDTPYPEWTLGILCSDQNNSLYNKTLEDLRPRIQQLESESIIGEIWSKTVLWCTGWPIKASEIFTGPFGGDTETPILFVSNTYDPITPIENALSSAPNYRNAQVLTIDGMGHTSGATQNTCGFAKVKAYFQATQLPGNDPFCSLEKGPFNIILNGTLEDNINQAGLSDLVD